MIDALRGIRPASAPPDETSEQREARIVAMAAEVRARFLAESRVARPAVLRLVRRIRKARDRRSAADLAYRLGDVLTLFEEVPEEWLDAGAAATYVTGLEHIRSVGGWPGRRARAVRLAERFGLDRPCSRSGAPSATQATPDDRRGVREFGRDSGALIASGEVLAGEAVAVGER